MKRFLALLLLLVVLPFAAFAVTDNPTATNVNSSGQPIGSVNVNYENQSNFGSVAAWGNPSTGNPGYLVLKGCDAGNRCFPYYFWVTSTGKLFQASYISISAFSSFPAGNWNATNFTAGAAVGSQ